jgi:hypothetical protein
VRLECEASVSTRTVQCAPPGTAAGARADRIYGQGTAMRLTSSNVAIVADSFTFDMTVTSLLEYPVGTTDGVNPDPNGIRVFFVDGIHTTQGSGSVTVANADGVDVFTASGQAYFRYLGVLQPGATTAARKWKLRFDPGVEHFSFGLYISTPVPPGGGTVQLSILEPKADTTLTDSVVVRVQIVSSPASIQSVKAYLANQVVLLTPYAAGLVRGTLSLAGLPFGPQQIRVHAVTVRADTGNAFVTIRKDGPPTLTVSAPSTGYVARPNVRIDADCVDDNPAGCASVTASISGVVIASGTSGIHADVSLASRNATQPTVVIDALDTGGHHRTASMSVYVAGDPLLTFADSAGRTAMDLDDSRLFFADAANGAWLRDRGTSARTLISNGVSGLDGRLFSLGAFFQRSASGKFYVYRSGVFTDLGSTAAYWAVRGDWAVWSNGASTSTVVRRDLAAGTNATTTGGLADVAANGDVVYVSTTGVRRWRGGGTTLVDAVGSSPVTDGINVVYIRSQQVWMWDGATSTALSNTLGTVAPHTYYEAAGGWVAYAVVDGGGANQLRVRAPGGTDRQITAYGTGSQIRALSADGTLAFGNAGYLYVVRAPYTVTPTRIGRDWFGVRFRGTELQLYLGNTVFLATY